MISPNIDLTEHRDFGSHSGFQFRLRDVLNDDLFEIDLPAISKDEYDAISWWEGIFGQRRHLNRKYQVFYYEARHERYWKETCVRCGRPLRIPWQRYYELCRYCNDDMNNERIPWKAWKDNESTRRHDTRDVFNLR